MKVIIAGSRTIKSYAIVRNAVVKSGLWAEYKHDLEIVCGEAKGVDLLGRKFAERNNLVVHSAPANWDKFGKAAGHIRNCEMGKFADYLIAVWDGRSKGTEHMIKYMRSLGKPVWISDVVKYKRGD